MTSRMISHMSHQSVGMVTGQAASR